VVSSRTVLLASYCSSGIGLKKQATFAKKKHLCHAPAHHLFCVHAAINYWCCIEYRHSVVVVFKKPLIVLNAKRNISGDAGGGVGRFKKSAQRRRIDPQRIGIRHMFPNPAMPAPWVPLCEYCPSVANYKQVRNYPRVAQSALSQLLSGRACIYIVQYWSTGSPACVAFGIHLIKAKKPFKPKYHQAAVISWRKILQVRTSTPE